MRDDGLKKVRTVGRRIIEHLTPLRTHELGPMDPWPPEATQDGIAAALGITRSHAALELGRLQGWGFVDFRLAHVRGAARRRRVYRANPNPYTVVNGAGTPLPIVPGAVATLKVVVFRCPSCGTQAKVALKE